MKVEDLIAELRQFPPHSTVLVSWEPFEGHTVHAMIRGVEETSVPHYCRIVPHSERDGRFDLERARLGKAQR